MHLYFCIECRPRKCRNRKRDEHGRVKRVRRIHPALLSSACTTAHALLRMSHYIFFFEAAPRLRKEVGFVWGYRNFEVFGRVFIGRLDAGSGVFCVCFCVSRPLS